MVSMVFMIFGLGIGSLFVFDKTNVEKLPVWLRIKSLGQLKTLMWETILFTLMIFAVTRFFKYPLDNWESLIFPIIILILSVSFYFVNRLGKG